MNLLVSFFRFQNSLLKVVLSLFLCLLGEKVLGQSVVETDSLPPEVAAYVKLILAEEDSLERLGTDYEPIMQAKISTYSPSLNYNVSFATCTLSPSAKKQHIHINCLQYMEEVNVLGSDGSKYDIPIVYYPNSTELNTNELEEGEYVILIQLEKSIFTKNIWVKKE